ncbi:hypothetical protein HDU91_003172 [Kappamyces sp. JEL0680]|nr:hypothetical protein HDU91_003172 [Kappamyces sp. JEL0680]
MASEEPETVPLKTESTSKTNLSKSLSGSKGNLGSKSNLLGSRANLAGSKSNISGSKSNLSGSSRNLARSWSKSQLVARESAAPPAAAANAIIYENTYRMKPDVKFGAGKVTAIINDLLQKNLTGKKYEADKVPELITAISNQILGEVKKLGYDRYKIVVQVDLGEFKGQGIKVASRSVWDTTTDTWASGSFKNPYYLTRKPDRGDQGIKETVFSLKSLQEAAALASETPVSEIRAELHKERKALHLKSQSRIKDWSNTIHGERTKRLAAADEKARLVEVDNGVSQQAERVRIDTEWAAVRNKEREDAIARARMLQRADEPRVRALHSNLLLSNILQERDRQLEYKAHREIANRIYEKEEVLKMRLLHLQALEKEKEQGKKTLQKRLEFTAGLKEAVDAIQSKKMEAASERASSCASETGQGFQQPAALDHQAKLLEAARIKETLALQIKEKQKTLTDQHTQMVELEKANARFNDMKNVLGEKRKDFITQQAAARIQRTEEVAKWNVRAEQEQETTRLAFLQALLKAQKTQDQDKEQKKAHNKQLCIEEREAFERSHRQKRQTKLEEDRATKLAEKAKHRRDAEQWKQEVQDTAEKKKASLLAIKAEHLEQMNYQALQKYAHHEADKKYDAAARAQLQRENAEFDEYATANLEEWARQNKNVTPILKSLERDRPGYSRSVGGQKEKKQDHFSRLGFTARHLPEPFTKQAMAMQEIQTALDDLKSRLENPEYDVGTMKTDWTLLYTTVKRYSTFTLGTEALESTDSLGSISAFCTKIDILIDDIITLFFSKWIRRGLPDAGSVRKSVYHLYASLCRIRDEMNHLKQSGLFTESILNATHDKLEKERHTLATLHIPKDQPLIQQCMELLQAKFDSCQAMLKSLQGELAQISSALIPIHVRLVEIKMELEGLIARKNPHAFSLVQVQVLQDELREIDSARIDGKYIARDGSVVPGQASVIDLLEAAFDDCHELLAARDPVDGENPLRQVYEDLIRIKNTLEQYATYPRWFARATNPRTLKGDDLIPFQVRLGKIDNMRSDGKFLAPDGTCPPGQAVLHFLLHKLAYRQCYRLVYNLQTEMEPVAESLMPIYNQLLTLQRCLQQLVKWNVEMTSDELIPYQIKLTQINKLHKDGVFYDSDGGIPEGQTLLFEVLEDCHEMVIALQSP